MKKLSLFLFLSVILSIAGTARSFDSTYSAMLQSKIEALKVSYGLKGISAAAYVPGQGLWLGASGISSETENVNTDMLFSSGSITKNFMAALILQLAEADSLNLDDPIGNWLPVFVNINNSVTVRQLLDHSSGIYSVTDNPAFSAAINSNLNRIWTAEEILNSGLVLTPYFAPGTSWHYSNTNYIIIAYIINKIMHTDISEQLHARFFTPLNMNESFFEVQDTITMPYAHNWVDLNGDGILDDASFVPTTAIYSATVGAGGVTSRPENLVKWQRALYSGSILNQSSLNQMLTFRNAVISGANGYGLGTMRYSINGVNCFGHGGNLFGYTAVMIYNPQDSISIAIMMNKDLDGGPVGKSFMITVITNNPVGIRNVSTVVPDKFSLYQNYPNPFNPETIIKFDLTSKQHAKLSVTNILGEEISILYNGNLQAGEYSYKWDALNYPGGIYFYKLQTEEGFVVKKMLLLK
ncbi:MAG: serine hydrolase [Ignavibacteria bacterium]|nr:serine hydrolase [Ignavibacteria bacterium]